MDCDNVYNFSKGTQGIKWFVFSNMANNKATGIRLVIRIIFNDLSCTNNMFNFFKRYFSAITTFLSMSRNYVFSFKKFLADLFDH